MELETANLIRKMQKEIDNKEQCLHNIKMAVLVPHFVSEKTGDERQHLIMNSIHKLHKAAGNKVFPEDKQDKGQNPIADLGMQKFKLAPKTEFKAESSPMGKPTKGLPRTEKSAEIEINGDGLCVKLYGISLKEIYKILDELGLNNGY